MEARCGKCDHVLEAREFSPPGTRECVNEGCMRQGQPVVVEDQAEGAEGDAEDPDVLEEPSLFRLIGRAAGRLWTR